MAPGACQAKGDTPGRRFTTGPKARALRRILVAHG
jgi:hypothetical protein